MNLGYPNEHLRFGTGKLSNVLTFMFLAGLLDEIELC